MWSFLVLTLRICLNQVRCRLTVEDGFLTNNVQYLTQPSQVRLKQANFLQTWMFERGSIEWVVSVLVQSTRAGQMRPKHWLPLQTVSVEVVSHAANLARPARVAF
jgi:hypothetical protein